MSGVGSLAPLTKSHTPIENAYYYHRGYYGWRRPYYGYGYRRPFMATAITAIDGPTIVVGGISRNADE